MKKKSEQTLVLIVALALEVGLIVLFAAKARVQGLEQIDWKHLAAAGLALFFLYILYVEIRIKRAGQTIVEEKVKTHTLVESLPQAVVVLDSERQMITANESACRMLGIDAVEAMGKPFAPLEAAAKEKRLRLTTAPLRGDAGSLVILEPEAAPAAKPAREKVDLAELARQALERAIPAAQAKNLKTEIRSEGDASVQAERGPLRRALEEVIANAVSYTKEGSVRVSVAGGSRDVTITCTDSGIGIPPEEFGSIFDEGFVGSNQLPETKGGSGLGLAIAKRAVEAHGGSVMVESRVGQGTRITLNIPRA